jgi:2-keto-4-pentenoate hydratase
MNPSLPAEDARAETILKAAEILRQAEDSGTPCAPIRDLFAEEDLDAAYRIQQININRRLESGVHIIGHKIGITSRAVQQQVGVTTPDFGVLMSDMIVDDGGVMDADRLLQPRAEAEIAIILGADLDTPSPNVADVLMATSFVLPAIEIVASRVENWDISIVDTIADNASCGLFVLGTPAIRPEGFAFADCKMELLANDQLVSSGSGRACLGNPLNAAAWLARQMQDLGTPLKAGEIVLTGALGPLAPMERGDKIEARIEGLGTASFSYGE